MTLSADTYRQWEEMILRQARTMGMPSFLDLGGGQRAAIPTAPADRSPIAYTDAQLGAWQAPEWHLIFQLLGTWNAFVAEAQQQNNCLHLSHDPFTGGEGYWAKAKGGRCHIVSLTGALRATIEFDPDWRLVQIKGLGNITVPLPHAAIDQYAQRMRALAGKPATGDPAPVVSADRGSIDDLTVGGHLYRRLMGYSRYF
jgi:hypothetical protein